MQWPVALFAAATLVASTSSSAAAPAVLTQRTLSFDAAVTVATVALAACRQRGFRVSISVLGVSGRPLVVLHDDGAPPHTIENSDRKAYTALTRRAPSADLAKRIADNPGSVGVLQLDRITTLEGGLPIIAGVDVVGAIGISGAPSGAEDIICAKAGLDSIAADLTAR